MKLNREWKFKEMFPSISAYVTTYNCLKGGYPIIEAIKSFAWVDELVVVDGGSSDGTVEAIEALGFENLSLFPIPIDWNNPGKDGNQKAMARAMCSKDFSIQFDADEICLGDVSEWKRLVKDMEIEILELPVLEPYGDICELRLNKEHNPSKWRIFRNIPEITHGIPAHDRLEKDGKTYSKGGSDGCYPIHIVSKQMLPSKLTKESSWGRHLFTKGDIEAYALHQTENLRASVPMVLHLGHVNISQKIRLFLNEWRSWWADLYGKDPNDLTMYWPNGINLEDAYDQIEQRAAELKSEVPTVRIEELAKYGDLTNANQGLSV